MQIATYDANLSPESITCFAVIPGFQCHPRAFFGSWPVLKCRPRLIYLSMNTDTQRFSLMPVRCSCRVQVPHVDKSVVHGGSIYLHTVPTVLYLKHRSIVHFEHIETRGVHYESRRARLVYERGSDTTLTTHYTLGVQCGAEALLSFRVRCTLPINCLALAHHPDPCSEYL